MRNGNAEDDLFVVVKKDVMCFNTLDNALHHFSASLTFTALCYNRGKCVCYSSISLCRLQTFSVSFYICCCNNLSPK